MKKNYVYLEYNDNSVSEKLVKASTDIEALKKYLKERAEKYFNCSWGEIEELYFSGDDTLSDTFIHYDDTQDYLTWEIIEVEVI